MKYFLMAFLILLFLIQSGIGYYIHKANDKGKGLSVSLKKLTNLPKSKYGRWFANEQIR